MHNSTRRHRRSAALAVVLAGLALVAGLAGCASSSTGATSASTVLRVGIPSGGAGTVLDPHAPLDAFSTYFAWTFYEPLGSIGEDGRYHDVLAESFTPNGDATSWTLVLKDGVTFHSGKALTADDVIFTFRRILDPATAAAGYGTASVIADMTRLDDRTVRFDLAVPRATFPELIADGAFAGIVPVGFDPAHPDSTGPWVFDSMQAGTEITLSRYDGYHGEPAAMPSLQLLMLPDEDARTNALLAGQIDVDTGLAATSAAAAQAAGYSVLDLETGTFQAVSMRVDQGVTADVRVRQALRLAVDRDQIVTVVDGGHGRVANDLYGVDDPVYRSDLIRTRDVAEAQRLVAEAGAQGAGLTIVTTPSMESLSQIVARNAREIGLEATVDVKDETTFYAEGYLQYDVAVDQMPGNLVFPTASIADGPSATLNATHFSDPEYDALFETASASLDPAARSAALSGMQQILFDRGGYIIPRFLNTLVAHRADLVGWPASDPTGALLYKSLARVHVAS